MTWRLTEQTEIMGLIKFVIREVRQVPRKEGL